MCGQLTNKCVCIRRALVALAIALNLVVRVVVVRVVIVRVVVVVRVVAVETVEFEHTMGDLFTQLASLPISEINVGASLNRMLDLANQCQVRLEGSFSTLVAGIIVIEGIARQLSAEFSLMQEAQPLLIKDKRLVKAYVKAKFKSFSDNLWGKISNASKDNQDILNNLASDREYYSHKRAEQPANQ
jgi:predicted unusual protein kinase regulating ubiquinone biosynthesis (AarF/ABC1/UbiB family)